MAQSAENNSFTAADIERYHKGMMSAEERHALEKAALDDPFLADALEGYAYTTTATEDIVQLQKRLSGRTERKKVVPMFFRSNTWLRVAVVILVVAGGVWLLYRSSSQQQKSIAIETKNKKEKNEITPVPGQNSNYVMPDSNLSIKNNAIDSKSYVMTQPKEEKPGETDKLNLNSDNAANTENRSSKELVLMDNAVTRKNLGRADENRTNGSFNAIAENNIRTNSGFINDSNRIQSNATANNMLSRRQATDNNSNPGSASANAEREQAKGTLFYKAPDTIRNVNVVMTPQATAPMQEVVVVGYGKQKKTSLPEARMKGIVIDTLEPAEGWTNFDEYVASNLKMPEEFKDKPLGGEVQLSFDVNDSGEPTNITIVKSLCTKCDEEAIRLLKEGPKWKKKKNKKGKVTIRF
jgi:hypothetical protein